MATATNKRIRHTVKRIKAAWADVSYAQRRLFEIRTGVPAIDRDQRNQLATSVRELEALYSLEDRAKAA